MSNRFRLGIVLRLREMAEEAARIDELLVCDDLRRKLLGEVEGLKAQRKRVSKEIGALMGQKKLAEAEAKKKETGDLGDLIAGLDKQAASAETAARRTAGGPLPRCCFACRSSRAAGTSTST